MKKVAISGAGLVGTLLSVFLARRGFHVELFEKRSDPRKSLQTEGRSINLALSHRGIHALKKAGLDLQVLSTAVPMYGRMIHTGNGNTQLQPYGKKDECIYSISRRGLNATLLEAADSYPNIDVHFNVKSGIVKSGNVYQLRSESLITKQVHQYTFDLICSCDGAFSVVRETLAKEGHCEASIDKLEHGYLELDIPAELGQKLERNALHIWPRERFMLIALPNLDGSFTGTLFLPFEGEFAFDKLKSEEEVVTFFKKHFTDAVDLIPELGKQFFHVEPSFLATVHSYPWLYSNVMLLGDAAHAIVPFYGQGMNAGFEDVRVMGEVLDEEKDLFTALNKLQELRKPNADAIADLAMQNFIEMRDLVTDEDFQLRKKIEAKIHVEYPNYLPLYSMVTFSDTTYSDAQKKGKEHDALMKKVLEIPGIANTWNTTEGWEKIVKVLKEEGF